MPSNQVYRGSYGYTLPITTGRDLTGATALLLEICAPSGRVVERHLTAANIADAAHGVVHYVVQPEDFSELDVYRLQLIDVSGGTQRLYYSPASLLVLPGEA